MKLHLTLALLLLTGCCCGTTRYIAATAGTFSGGSACNGQTAITPATWNSTAESAGDVSYVCGTFTGTAGSTLLTVGWSGTSGSPITLVFDTGATLSAPYWSGSNGAIYANGQSWIIVNGGTNGIIQNTANGTSLANQQTSFGVVTNNCTYCNIENLNIRNIYVNQGSSSSATDSAGSSSVDIEMFGNSTGSTVTGNTLSQARAGVIIDYDGGYDASNTAISYNNISDMDWCAQVAANNAASTATNVQIFNNTCTNWTNWAYPSATYHQDGIFVFNYAGGNVIQASIYNNYIYGDLTQGSPTAFIYCAQYASCAMFNNLLVNTGHQIDGIIWVGSGNSCSTIYNNTIIGMSGTNDAAITFGVGDTGSCAPSVQNNIIENVQLGINTYATTFTGLLTVSNHNIWYNVSNFGNQSSPYFYTYAQWQSYGYDAASSTANPNLNGSYLPTAALSSGANLYGTYTALNADKANVARPASGAWGVGAYQYVTAGNPNPPVLSIMSLHP